ncbi:MAG: hypothetical protein IPI59_03600 [Sphingobacteriales bacterium]|nr:hypothetical protein [Sphingobacteriales bacterium]MCC7057585.1 hypothetical protein [Chitinophagales bacterium]MBK6890304.1 hypothetical protein [Sphingobacteriales bacterium]MBK7526641.1 hypothetical protein [Sphingobacteriales bacterium]MBK8678493.1 hypothetical protein [Sphingobacteriales bacterium]
MSLLLPDKIASAHFPDKFTPSFFYPDKIKAARLKIYFIQDLLTQKNKPSNRRHLKLIM